MNILIIGGGIGGPALATFLVRQGKSVTLVEQSPEWKNIGFGVTVWGIGRKILRELGADEKLSQFGHPVPAITMATPNGSELIEIDFKQFADFGGEILIVPRAKLHELIIESMPSTVEVLLGIKVEKVEQKEQQTQVTFSNGTSKSFDLVVGADGVYSKTREMVSPVDITYDKWSFIVFWVPENISSSKNVVCVSEAGRTLCSYPTKDKAFIAIASYGSEVKNIDVRKCLIPFVPHLLKQGWSKDDIEKLITENNSLYKDDLKYVPMGPWSKDRLALLGDARHAFAPIIGMGASLALEDAQVLAEELSKVDIGNITTALKRYAERRTPRVNKIRGFSRRTEPWFNTRSRFFALIRKLLAPHLPRFFIRNEIVGILKQKI